MSTGACAFGVLGPLLFERDGRAVAVPSGHQRSLLVVLLAAGGAPVPRDRLIEELWGERPPASAVSTLHVHLSKLRALLDGLLVLTAGGYALATDMFELDVQRFDALVERARTDPAQARDLLAQALALFRGDPLGDVAAERSVALWRRELEEKHLGARIARLDAELAAGGGPELVAELERLSHEHPFEERLTGQLMLALHRAGRQADALEAYQRARRRFAGELGIEPGAPLRRLQAQILEQDECLVPAQLAGPEAETTTETGTRAAPDGRPGRDASGSRSQLPHLPTRLVAREQELAALSGLAADPDVRLITLTGTGGVGKTRLQLAFAHAQAPHFTDGAVFVRLERVTDPALVRAEIAITLAQRDGAGRPTADGLNNYLRDRELLLALDNFEHLLGASTLVAELLAEAPGLRVLVSSRSPLRIRGEQLVGVQPLSLPADDGERAIGESAAAQLFLHYALAANRALVLGGSTMRAIARICRAVDGLPLAIELAASRARNLTPQEIAQQLGEPLSLGAHSLRDLPDRHQSLEATIRWSYDLLSPGARAALRAASPFRGGFDLAALDAVCGAAAGPALEELDEASLVSRSSDPGRWVLLELVRAFALAELDAEGHGSITRRRHREHFTAVVVPTIEAFDSGVSPGDIAAPLHADHANLRAALDDAIATDDQDAAVKLALGMRALWFTGALHQEASDAADRLLGRFRLSPADEIALLKAATFGASYSGDASSYQRLAARGAELGDVAAQLLATLNLFSMAVSAQDRAEMRQLRPTLVAFLSSTSSDRERAYLHYYLALDAYVDGQLDASCAHAAASVASARAIDHDYLLGAGLSTGLLAQSERDGTIPHPALSESVTVARKVGVPALSAFVLWLVAAYAAGVAPETAGRWIAHGERIRVALDSALWPETVPRDEALAALGIADITSLLPGTPVRDHAEALADAAAWLADRAPDECARRLLGSTRADLEHGKPGARG